METNENNPIDISWAWQQQGPILPASEELRKHLRVGEEFFLRVAGSAWADPRDYVLYGALDEVAKTSLQIMRLKEILSEPPEEHDGLWDRLITRHILEEEHLRIRRLTEVLVTLVHFSETNEQEYYRHFLAIEELGSLLWERASFAYSWRQPNATSGGNVLEYRIDHDISAVLRAKSRVDPERSRWYESSVAGNITPGWRPQNIQQPGQLLTSAKARINRALEKHLLDELEILCIGFTYEGGFSAVSETIHYSAVCDDWRLDSSAIYKLTSRMTLLCWAVLRRVHSLMGRPSSPWMDAIEQDVRGNEVLSRIIRRTTIGDLAVGDFVVADGRLAEIAEIETSALGYRSCRVLFLLEERLPNITEDVLPIARVRKFIRQDELRDKAHSNQTGFQPDDAETVACFWREADSAEIQEVLRDAVKDLWQAVRIRRAID